MASDVRIERDTFGEIEVPAERLWGAQTQRSLEHFRISGEQMPPELIRALALVKRACATVNRALGALEPAKADAIIAAADEVLAGEHDAEFPLVVWQTGLGHADQHEHERGAREPRLRAPRRRARRRPPGAPERRREPRPVLERRVSRPRCTSPRSKRSFTGSTRR